MNIFFIGFLTTGYIATLFLLWALRKEVYSEEGLIFGEIEQCQKAIKEQGDLIFKMQQEESNKKLEKEKENTARWIAKRIEHMGELDNKHEAIVNLIINNI